ncbi:MAG: DUF554 domain-containing protein [Bacteroidia bacterium]|nr:DUF554 domain-containing protein [Bacteroidia bacterium]
MIGTWINAASILLGGLLGLLIKNSLQKRYTEIVFQALGLFTILLGVKLGLKGTEVLVVILSLVFGAVMGEAMKLDERVRNIGTLISERLNLGSEGFTKGFATALLLFCIGPMSTLGALDDGLGISRDLLMTKSTLDGISSMVLSAAFGPGVIFSIIPLLILQGGTSLLAEQLAPFLSEDSQVLDQLSSVGGVMLIGIGINILEIKQLRVMNLFPALLFVFLFSALLPYLS